MQAQRGVLAGDLVDDLHRGQEAAGEDVLVDPRVGVAGGQHPVVRHRDRLDGDLAAGGEHPVDGLEVGLPVLPADRLDHLDRDHGVVLPGDVAVVAQLDRDLVGVKPRRGDRAASASAFCSVDRVIERDRRAAAGGADAQLAPAGADLEHPAARADAGLVEQALDLAALGLLEVGGDGGGRVALEERARSSSASGRGTARRGRWTGRSGARCCPGSSSCCSSGCAGGRLTTSARSLCRLCGHEVLHLRGQHLQEATEVLGVPRAGEVGLAEADQLVAPDPGEELLGPVDRPSTGPPRPRSRSPTTTVTSSRLTAALKSRRAIGGRDARRGDRTGRRRGRASGWRSTRSGAMVIGRLPGGGAGAGAPADGGATARCRGRG